ncbi:MAG TPA: site-specific tyrosine recombinase [Acidimicrobiales bacterium]|nr:site-specific tyrosine recombinase [Acidimicrobiales bacterium]
MTTPVEDEERPALSADAEEFLTWLAVEQGRSRNTIAAYRRDLTAYEGYVRHRGLGLDDVDLTVLEAHLDERRAAGIGPRSRARALAAIRGLHRFRLEEGRSTSDPTADLQAPPAPLRLPKALEPDEVLALLAAAEGPAPVDRRDRAILEVLYGTGMRVSELVGLSLGDLGSDTGLVRVLGKGSKERLVPLGRFAAEALARWLGPGGREALEPRRWARRGDAEAVFLNVRGGRLTRQGVWGVIDKRATRAGLGGRVHPHVLRHSCASHMLANGADIRVVQELLGHASLATTQIYTRVSPEHLRRAYEQAHPRAVRRAGQ